jgi:hypothetical protein
MQCEITTFSEDDATIANAPETGAPVILKP